MDDANLSKLSVKSFTIEPIFQKTLTEYSLIVPSSTDIIEIEATTNDSSASYFIKHKERDGNKCNINEGLTKITIEVSSEDGTTKQYNINCTRLSASDANLSNLSITNAHIQPNFDKNNFDYFCPIAYSHSLVDIDAQVNDPKCEIKLIYNNKEEIKTNSSKFAINLNYGISCAEIHVKSPNGIKTQIYKITIKKSLQPRYVKFKNQNDCLLYEDPISLSPLYCVTKLKGLKNNYSEPFIEYFYNQSKQDFLSGSYLHLEIINEWKDYPLDIEVALSKCEVVVPLINGENTDIKLLREIGPIIKETQKLDQLKPSSQVQFILEYDSNLNDLMHKHENKRPWEKKLMNIYDETDPQKLIEASDKHLQIYYNLKEQHYPYKKYEKDNTPLDVLDLAIYNCASAMNYKNLDHELNFKLAMLLEEKHHLEDVLGFKNEEETTENEEFTFVSNKKAKESSKEEEIDAICKLRNVPANGTIEQKLKALDEEYHSLLQSGQTHKAEQVQLLYHFKVQQTKMDASLSAKAGDNQKSLGRAYIKYLDALFLTESMKITKYLYHFHVGRMHCMRSNFQIAIKHFTICLQWNNEEYGSLVKFYLGYALSLEKTVLKTRYEEAVYYLCNGLQVFLSKLSVKQPDANKKLYAENLYTLTNPVFCQAFINIATIGNNYKITKFNYITPKDALHNCAWLCCRTLYQISLNCADSVKNLIKTSETIKQINWLLVKAHSYLLEILTNTLANSNKSSTKKLLEKRCFYLSSLLRNINKDNNLEILNLQEKICQKLILLNPSDNYFLYLLANSQLEKYDYESVYNKNENLNILLEECKNTLLASIQLEDKTASGEPLKFITEQRWWIDMTSVKKEEKKVDEIKPQTVESVDKKLDLNTSKVVSSNKPAVKTPALTKQTTAKAIPQSKTPQITNKKQTKPTNDTNSKNKQVETPPTATTPQENILQKIETTQVIEKPASAASIRDEPAKINKKISQTRLLLARVYFRLDDIENSKKYYNLVIDSESNNYDAYIELADMLKSKGDSLGAVDVYTKFKNGYTSLSFDDAYIFGEIVSILMKNEKYDDIRLVKYMVLWAKVLGIGVLDKYIKKLDEKNKTKICKEIYCGVHNKNIDDPELQNFFKFKGWI